MKFFRFFLQPVWLLVLFCALAYYPFFLQGKVPFPGDVVVGAYYPWLDYKWGYIAGVPVKNSLLSDSFSQFLPWKYLAVELMQKGEWPLWNNYSYSGYPLLANYASSPFQPFNLLLLLPKHWGWGLYVFGQSVMAALGMYFYLKLFIKNPWARIIGSFVFAFSSLMTTWVEFGTGVYAAAMLPWIFSFIERFWADGRWRYLFLLTMAATILFLSGHAQLTTFSSVLVVCYLIFKSGFSKFINKKSLLVGLFWGLGIVLSLAQLLPVFSNTSDSIRAAEAFSRSINYGLNSWFEMIRLTAADFFGNPATNNYWSKVFYAEQSSFLGTLTIPFIFPFILKRFRNRQINFWGTVFIVVIFLAVDSPITQWFYSLPLPFLTYSNASRIFFLMSLSAGVLVAYGVEMLDRKDYQKWVFRSLTWLLSVFIGVIVGVGVIRLWIGADINSSEIITIWSNLKVTLRNLILPIGLVLGGLGLLGVWGRLGRQREKFLLIILTLLFVFDLSRYFLKLNPFVPQQFVFPSTPITEYLKNQPGLHRVSRADKELMPPNTWIPYKLQFVEGYDPLVNEDYVRYFKVLDSQGYNSGIDRFSELNNYPSKFLDAANVKYFLAVKRSEKAEIGKGESLNYRLKETNYKKVFEDKATVVMENPNALERVYFVSKVMEFDDKAKLIENLQSKEFDPTKTALIIGEKPAELEVSPGLAEITSYKATEILMKTNSDNGGFVVMSDNFDKGWNLEIDGQRRDLKQVNGSVRGFWADKGEHQVKMYYWPDSFDLGLKLSGLGLTALLALIGFSFKKKWF